MKKNHIVSFALILLLLGIALLPIVEGQINAKNPEFKNWIKPITDFSGSGDNNDICTPENEGDHFPCGWECWCYHASLTLENGEHWDAATIFVYFVNKTRKGYTTGVSYYRLRHWNRQTGKFYDNFRSDDFPGVFQTEKNKVNVTYINNSFQGLYPDYIYHGEDEINNIITNLQFHAISSPCWFGQNSSNGTLPWGISGIGRVYFVPMLELVGNISINGTLYNLTGVAYYEHDFGFFDFANPQKCYSIEDFINATKAYRSRKKWLRSEVRKNRHERLWSLHLSNDYLFGWNWGWVIFDNGWSLVIFRPTQSLRRDGLVPSFLYFSKDGETYHEIGCTYWDHVNEKYIEKADIYIPIDFELTAYKDDIEFHLIFNATTEITELYSKDFASYSKQEGGTFFACGIVRGHYKDNEDNVALNGTYALDQTRWLPRVVKHRSLDIDLLVPPNGLGLSVRKVSHRFGFERFFKIQLRPKFEFVFYIKPTHKSGFLGFFRDR